MQAARRCRPQSACLLSFIVIGISVLQEGSALRAREEFRSTGHRRRGTPKDPEEIRPIHLFNLTAAAERKAAKKLAKERERKEAEAAVAKAKANAARVKFWQEANRSRLEDEDNPFRNITLVVHCRLRGHLNDSICDEREHLFEGYKKFFPEVHYMHQRNCPRSPNNPHNCLARLMQRLGDTRDGIFYMHFDALIKPRHLGRGFNKDAIGTFDDYETCGINATDGDQVDCYWDLWSSKRATSFQTAIRNIRRDGPPELRDLDPTHFYLGNDDLFYLPRSIFRLYAPISQHFQDMNVHHEISGPTLRHILHNITNVPIVNMQCTGSCCYDLDEKDALSPDFRCGHSFNLRETPIQDAIPGAMLLHAGPVNTVPSMEHLQRIMDSAVA